MAQMVLVKYYYYFRGYYIYCFSSQAQKRESPDTKQCVMRFAFRKLGLLLSRLELQLADYHLAAILTRVITRNDNTYCPRHLLPSVHYRTWYQDPFAQPATHRRRHVSSVAPSNTGAGSPEPRLSFSWFIIAHSHSGFKDKQQPQHEALSGFILFSC